VKHEDEALGAMGTVLEANVQLPNEPGEPSAKDSHRYEAYSINQNTKTLLQNRTKVFDMKIPLLFMQRYCPLHTDKSLHLSTSGACHRSVVTERLLYSG
jgi:hypothetical protein